MSRPIYQVSISFLLMLFLALTSIVWPITPPILAEDPSPNSAGDNRVPDYFGVTDIKNYFSSVAQPKSPEEYVVLVIDLLLSLIAFAAFIAVVVGGLQYMSSLGNEEKAATGKRTVVYAVTGLIISVSLITIISVVSNQLKNFLGPS